MAWMTSGSDLKALDTMNSSRLWLIRMTLGYVDDIMIITQKMLFYSLKLIVLKHFWVLINTF